MPFLYKVANNQLRNVFLQSGETNKVLTETVGAPCLTRGATIQRPSRSSKLPRGFVHLLSQLPGLKKGCVCERIPVWAKSQQSTSQLAPHKSLVRDTRYSEPLPEFAPLSPNSTPNPFADQKFSLQTILRQATPKKETYLLSSHKSQDDKGCGGTHSRCTSWSDSTRYQTAPRMAQAIKEKCL